MDCEKEDVQKLRCRLAVSLLLFFLFQYLLMSAAYLCIYQFFMFSILHYIYKIKANATSQLYFGQLYFIQQNKQAYQLPEFNSCYIQMDPEQRQTFQIFQTSYKTTFEDYTTSSKLEDINQPSTIKILKIQHLISILQNKIPHERNQKDVRAISDLLKQVPYFSSLARNQKMLSDISSWIQYRKIQNGSFVYKIGNPSQCFYILLKGEVQLSYPEKIVDNAQEQEIIQQTYSPILKRMLTQPPLLSPSVNSSVKQIPESQLKRVTKKLSLKDEMFLVTPIATPQKPKVQFQERIIRVVSQGESFGDLGETNRRGTNAIARQVSHLIIIKKQFYSEIAKAHLKSEGKLKFQFLTSLHFFKLAYRHAVQSLMYFLQQHKVGYNNIIYNQQDHIKYIYIVYKGEFKLYKKVTCKKKQSDCKQQSLQIQQTRIPQRNICYKTIQVGEILAHLQAFHQNSYHLQSCVCKSQQGVILRIDKSKFMKKILSSEHNIMEIMNFIKEQYQLKIKQLSQFVGKQENDALYVRYLHTPSARSRKIKTQSAAQIQKKEKKQHLRKLSTASDNFFIKINQTVSPHLKSKRISINRNSKVKESQQRNVPSCVKDIIQLVKHQSNYQSLRKPQKDVSLFQFNISKVPLHVKKKFDFLFKKNTK